MNTHWTKGTGEDIGVVAQEYQDKEHHKIALKEAHKDLTNAGFIKQSTEKKHVPSQKMGRSTAYSGSSDKSRTQYQHSDGRKAVLISRSHKFGPHSVAIHHDRNSATQHSEQNQYLSYLQVGGKPIEGGVAY